MTTRTTTQNTLKNILTPENYAMYNDSDFRIREFEITDTKGNEYTRYRVYLNSDIIELELSAKKLNEFFEFIREC